MVTPTSNAQDGGTEGRTTKRLSFPLILHNMLDLADKEGFNDSVSWHPLKGSTFFRVIDHGTFVSKVLPRFYSHSNFKSFQRQLNLWGFERVTSGESKGAYGHKFFVKGEPEQCKNMVRRKFPRNTAAAVAKAASRPSSGDTVSTSSSSSCASSSERSRETDSKASRTSLGSNTERSGGIDIVERTDMMAISPVLEETFPTQPVCNHRGGHAPPQQESYQRHPLTTPHILAANCLRQRADNASLMLSQNQTMFHFPSQVNFPAIDSTGGISITQKQGGDLTKLINEPRPPPQIADEANLAFFEGKRFFFVDECDDEIK